MDPRGAVSRMRSTFPPGTLPAEGRARAARCPGPNGGAEGRPGVHSAGVSDNLEGESALTSLNSMHK